MALSRTSKMVALAGVTAAAIGGIAFGPSAFASTTGLTHHAAAPVSAKAGTAGTAAKTGKAAPKAVSQEIGHGTVDGTAWSVNLKFYPTLPAGWQPPTSPPGMPAQPTPTALLCQQMTLGGVQIDHQAGQWADCQGVVGAHDLSFGGGAGLWGFENKGTSGDRLFVADTVDGVAYGKVTLTNGDVLTGKVSTVPGTGYHAWAVAIPDNRTIASVDMYDANDHVVDHDTDWR